MCEACMRRGCSSTALLSAPAAAPALCPCTSRQCGSLDAAHKLGMGDNTEKPTAHAMHSAIRHASTIQANQHHYTPKSCCQALCKVFDNPSCVLKSARTTSYIFPCTAHVCFHSFSRSSGSCIIYASNCVFRDAIKLSFRCGLILCVLRAVFNKFLVRQHCQAGICLYVRKACTPHSSAQHMISA
jgi:hypothetical protein